MEVNVVSNAGLPDNCILSIRSGNVRRQAPIMSGKSFKFSSPLTNPLKFDVLVPLGSGHLVARKGVEQYRVHFTEGGEMGCEVAIKESQGASETTAEDNKDKKMDAVAAKEYLESHRLLEFFQAVIHTIIAEKPNDPYAEIARHFMNGYGQNGKIEKPITKLEEVSSARTETTAPQASSRTESTNRRPQSAQTIEALEETEKKAEEEQKIAEEERRKAEALEATKKKTEEEQKIAEEEQRKAEAKSAPRNSRKASAALMKGLKSGEVGKLVDGMEALEETKKKAEEEQKIAEEERRKAEAKSAPTASRKASAALMKGLKSGEVGKLVDGMEALEETKKKAEEEQKIAEEERRKTEATDMNAPRGQVGNLLSLATIDGSLEKSFQALEEQDNAGFAPGQSVAIGSGTDNEKAPTNKDDMRLEVQEKLLAACETGDLQKHLKEVVQLSSTLRRSPSQTDEDLRVEMRTCIVDACDKGTLLDALRSISGTVSQDDAPSPSV